MVVVQESALILRRLPIGETDLLVTLFFQHEGIRTAVARGARKGSRRLGSLEPFHTLRVTLQHPERDLATLRESSIETVRANLLRSLAAMQAAGKALSWTRHLFPVRTASPEAFDIVLRLLDDLEGGGAPEPSLSMLGVSLLQVSGFALNLRACVRCGATPPKERAAAVDVHRGGVVCRACGGGPLVLDGATRTFALRPTSARGGATGVAHEKLIRMVEHALCAHASYDSRGDHD